MPSNPETEIHPLYLNGEWVTTKESTPVANPATGEVFARVSSIDRTRVAQAIKDAQAAFAIWKKLTAKVRGDFLLKIAAEVERRREEIARLITLENGKPLAQSQAELTMTMDHLRWFAEECKRAYGRIVPPHVENKRHFVLKQPIGVVAAISPWNFPLVLGIRKAAPALAAGCPVMLKPARQTPLSTLAFAECAHAAELPKGVFQVICGSAKEIGQEFLQNPLCRKVTFTGSTEVGKELIRGAAEGVKPLSLELGGQAPLLVFEDANLPAAVEGAMIAKFRNTGQSCIAANRIYVQSSIYERFLVLLVEKTKNLIAGDGLAEGTQIGPLIDASAVQKALEHVEDAVKLGARLLCGGAKLPGKGHFFAPTVLADVPDRSLCMQEETFAPIAPVTPFETESEAVDRANASNFGLSAYVFTQSLQRAMRLMENLEAGMIGLNDPIPTATHCPFGGVKQSGWGRELGSEGLESFLETKHVSIGL